MRGKLSFSCSLLGVTRITPAGAGKTADRRLGRVRAQDHPRRCGENAQHRSKYYAMQGSPPQVRGKRDVSPLREDHNGITPAGAGKTMSREGGQGSDQDHPRRCGENRLGKVFYRLHSGSPPQVRGKLSVSCSCSLKPRITPAGAGKTLHNDGMDGRRQDHPRRCGENSLIYAKPSIYSGSPPQVRGKPCPERGGREATRITPAGAGKTDYRPLREALQKDHPRRCGENSMKLIRTFCLLGSPPQVRGKPLANFTGAEEKRITPAGAGKTPYLYYGRVGRRDHPRRCGENLYI